jgi:hypothetical protein
MVQSIKDKSCYSYLCRDSLKHEDEAKFVQEKEMKIQEPQ